MLIKEFDLSGKVAVIITQSENWIKTFVNALAQRGASVVPITNDISSGLIKESEISGDRGIALKTNIINLEDIRHTVEMILSKYGKIDILINNMAIGFAKPFSNSTESEWRNIIDKNLICLMLWCQFVGRHMLERKSGRIINIISGLSVRGMVNNTIYCATMGAIHQFTKALALEWARENIRVNSIAFGHMLSGDNGKQVINDMLIRYIPLRRLGEPLDLTGPLIFLSSDASDYITGETFFVDGGLICHG